MMPSMRSRRKSRSGRKMSDKNEKLFCFGEQECVYGECSAYHKELDECLNEGIFSALKNLFAGDVMPKPVNPFNLDQPAVPVVNPMDLKHVPPGCHQIVEAIIKLKPNLTVEAITELAEIERAKAGGLLTMEAAYYLVSSNLGAEERKKPKKEKPKPRKKTSGGDKKNPTFAELEEGGYARVIKGTLLDDPETFERDTSRGPTTITNFRITDGTAELRVGLWGELGADYGGEKGDNIHLTGMGIKNEYEGVLQISSTKNTEIK